MIYNEKAECMSANEKEELQLKRLQKVVKRAYENVPYYRQRLEEAGVSPEDIQTLNIIQKNRDLRELNNKNKKDTILIKTQVLRTDSLSTVLSFDEIVKPPR